jgi:short-chain Z-isoprenyl diphosphate synthase
MYFTESKLLALGAPLGNCRESDPNTADTIPSLAEDGRLEGGVIVRAVRILSLSGWMGAWPDAPRRAIACVTRQIYRLYEAKLLGQIELLPVPRHIGIILDGNRRYAAREGLARPEQAYRLGAQKLDDVIAWCVELEIPAVTLWVFSTENLARPQEQVEGILAAIDSKMLSLVHDPHIHAHRIRVKAIGRIAELPASLQASIGAAEQATAAYEGMLLSIAVAYGGRDEITDAVRAILSHAAAEGRTLVEATMLVSPESIGQHLYLADAPEPDLIIRTSGEIRLSGFLLWKSATSEFYFTDVLWPAFRKVDFLRAVRSFQERTRRFGR